ncbi:Gfo/Idh/MocA family oxidoreductase [bacterium]|nr:Gfo/Idh/MocA family oxidoreductase [bacterium]
MKQITVQDGRVMFHEVPVPAAGDDEVLVKIERSYLAIGTGSAPGNGNVRSGENPPPLFSAAGTVAEAGKNVHDLFPGDRVACVCMDAAGHAGYKSFHHSLTVPVPDKLNIEEAALVAPGAAALQGVRRARPTLGEHFIVVGMGLTGQITFQLLKAEGCRVTGIDTVSGRLQQALEHGLDSGFDPGSGDFVANVKRITGGMGADGIILTVPCPDDILMAVYAVCRKKARVVLVDEGICSLSLAGIQGNEFDISIAASMGPGISDSERERGSVDFPLGYVRWTDSRNMAEYLRLAAEGIVTARYLVEGVYPLENIQDACDAINGSLRKPSAILVSFPETAETGQPVQTVCDTPIRTVKTKPLRVAVIGAGSFAQAVHIPNIRQNPDLYALEAVACRTGEHARAAAEKLGISRFTADYEEILENPEIDAVVIATRHNLHAHIALKALKSGKHVLVENPLAMNRTELDTILDFYSQSGEKRAPLLMTGFNRRFSPLVSRIREILENRTNPMVINYRMNAEFLPPDHWLYGAEGGGRNIGEACHIYDLFTCLTDSPALSVEALSIRPPQGKFSSRDNFVATITFGDGSLATLTCTTLGSSGYPKDLLEIYCDNRVFVLDDFSALTGYGIADVRMSGQNGKGEREEIEAFARAVVEGGPWPVPLWQQVQAMDIAFEMKRLLMDTSPE